MAHLDDLKECAPTVMEIERGELGENADDTRVALAAGPTSWNVSRHHQNSDRSAMKSQAPN